MATKRQLQIGELIRRTFGMIMMQEGPLIYGHKALVTVTNVVVTPDLGMAKVYLSVWNAESKQEVILEIEEHTSRFRSLLGNKLGKQLRRIPSLTFFLDDTVDEMYRVEQLLDENSNPKSEEEE